MTDISKSLRELLLARAAGQIDAEEFERRQAALHAEVLASTADASHRRGWLLGGSIVVLALAIGVYFWKTSEPASAPVAPPPMMSAMPPAMPPAMTPDQKPNAGGDLKTMSVRLAEKLAKDPTNGEGWALLGQTYVELRQYKDADRAFAKADGLGKMDDRLREEWKKAKAAMAGAKPAP